MQVVVPWVVIGLNRCSKPTAVTIAMLVVVNVVLLCVAMLVAVRSKLSHSIAKTIATGALRAISPV